MTDSRVETILRRQQRLESARSNFDTLWQEVAELILPGEANFTTQRSAGEDRTERQLDGTGALALRKYAAMVESLLMPASAIYQKLVPAEELAENQAVKQWMEAATKRVFKARYSPLGGFTGQTGSITLGFGSFGTQGMFIGEPYPGAGIRYQSAPLADTFFAENAHGRIDTCHWRRRWNAQQAVDYYRPIPGAVIPAKVLEDATKNPDRLYTFVQCVVPVNQYDGRHLERRGFGYASVHVCVEEKTLVHESGFRSFPFAIMRDIPIAGEVYGRSPAIWALPQLKMLNAMKRSILRGAQLRVEPPILLQDDGALESFRLKPGALNFGGIGANGEILAAPFQAANAVELGEELLAVEQRLINESFFVTLFQIMVENPKMTATEVLERTAEKGQLLGPTVGRQNGEWLGPLIQRELELLAEAGELPEMPDELIEAGGAYEVRYESPIARAQRAEEGAAIVRTLTNLMPLAERDPGILDNYDLDGLARDLGEIEGVPAKRIRAAEVVEQIRADRKQQEEMVTAAQLAPGVAKAAKDMSGVPVEA